jgi:hypothetical protein
MTNKHWRIIRRWLRIPFRFYHYTYRRKSPGFEELPPDDIWREIGTIRDTGGSTKGYKRPTFRSQYGDNTEGHTTPHSEGYNCTCASAGMAMDFHTAGGKVKKGGDMRHNCPDNVEGTDLYDMRAAWEHYGQSLSIRSGQGWGEVMDCLREGRGVILQGMSSAFGSGCSAAYDGAHAIYVHPEKNAEGKWLMGDPICSGWQWKSADILKEFAQRFSGSICFAVTKVRDNDPPPPEPEPEPEPEPDDPTPYPSAPKVPLQEICDHEPQVTHARLIAQDADVTALYDWYIGIAKTEPAIVRDAKLCADNGTALWDLSNWRQAIWEPVRGAHWDISKWDRCAPWI